MKCKFCGGNLGCTETQNHPSPDYAEFKTCLKCGHQWAKCKWAWLKDCEIAQVEMLEKDKLFHKTERMPDGTTYRVIKNAEGDEVNRYEEVSV